MKRIISPIALLIMILMPSCTRFTYWAHKTFHMPDKIEVDLAPARSHISSVRAYDQFRTIAIFDVLWLSNTVLHTFSELYAVKWCKEEEVESIFNEQLAEHADAITFYVLIAEKEGIAFKERLGKWSFALEVDGVQYAPISVKIIDDLPYEYRKIFGDLYNPFKVTYEMQFDAYTAEGMPVIGDDTSIIQLCVSSTEYREYCTYNVEPSSLVNQHYPRID